MVSGAGLSSLGYGSGWSNYSLLLGGSAVYLSLKSLGTLAQKKVHLFNYYGYLLSS